MFIGEVVHSEMVKKRECYVYFTGTFLRIASWSNFSFLIFPLQSVSKYGREFGGLFN